MLEDADKSRLCLERICPLQVEINKDMIWGKLGGVGVLFKRMILHGVKCLLGLTECFMQENKDKFRSAISGRRNSTEIK